MKRSQKGIVEVLFAAILAAVATAYGTVSVPAPTVKNYSGRDFAKPNPNEGFPSYPVESAGEAGGAL